VFLREQPPSAASALAKSFAEPDEKRAGGRDENWPACYADYMVAEQARYEIANVIGIVAIPWRSSDTDYWRNP
jgi:hypothetical protein